MAKPTLTKKSVEIDLTGVEAAARRSKVVIPEGDYRAKVISVETKKFATGSKGVVWVFEITDKGKGKGSRFYYNNVLVDAEGKTATKSLWSFRGVLQALTPKIKIPDSMLKIQLGKLEKRTVALEIVDGEDDKGKTRSEISDVYNEELLEEEEEEEELEDDDDDEIDLDEDEL